MQFVPLFSCTDVLLLTDYQANREIKDDVLVPSADEVVIYQVDQRYSSVPASHYMVLREESDQPLGDHHGQHNLVLEEELVNAWVVILEQHLAEGYGRQHMG